MSERSDLVGLRFGRWTVVRLSHVNRHRQTYFLCRCDCGVERAVYSTDLKLRKNKSCGCWRREESSARLRDDLTGKRFGRFLVLSFHSVGSHRKLHWLQHAEWG
jgi:hypothetical protein